MQNALKKKLKGFKTTLYNYKNHQIVPIHSEALAMKQIYEEIGHQPLGNCSACYNTIFLTLWDHIIEERI